jgi:polar amino acid transport system ATP-binding protein
MIRIVNLVKRFGENTVLKGITLDVNPGEIVGLIGPSGGGKTTLLRCMNFLTPFEEGKVIVDEIEVIPSLDPGELQKRVALVRRRVGMVFQQFNLFPHKSALENVMEAPIQVLKQPPAKAEERARELLTQVGLAHRTNAYPARLSGGEQQRVAIARALAMDPELILFDEPTSALDPERVGDVVALMKDLASRGITMMIVTHSIGFIRAVSDRVAFMADGEIVEVGPPHEVLEHSQQERTRKFLSQEELLR